MKQNNNNKNLPPITKWLMLCFIMSLSIALSGCTMLYVSKLTSEYNANWGIQSVPQSVLQTEIERFQQANGYSCFDLPELYDISHLKAGSTVKVKVKMTLIDSKMPEMPSYDATKTLNEINTTEKGDTYVIAVEREEPVRKLKREIADIMKKDMIENLLAYTSVFVVPLPVLIIYSEAKNYERYQEMTNIQWEKKMKQEIDNKPFAKMSRLLCENTIQELYHPNTRTNIVDFKFISHEDLIIAGRTVLSKVYQIDRITLSKTEVGRPEYVSRGIVIGDRPDFVINDFVKWDTNWDTADTTRIMNDSAKLWVSDEVPFGIVKAEHKSFFIWQVGSDVFKRAIITNLEVTEFKY